MELFLKDFFFVKYSKFKILVLKFWKFSTYQFPGESKGEGGGFQPLPGPYGTEKTWPERVKLTIIQTETQNHRIIHLLKIN